MSHATGAIAPTVSAQLLGREREAHLLALALVAREHVLLVGPPGTAKSHLCRTTAATIDGARYCERLLSPTTAPEAVWGPVSIAALREDRYEHVTAGYAADAHVLYLDEVGRASPAILDTLLHLLGPERQALVGTAQVKAPLVSAIGSANTWPDDAALLDRWLLRATVNYLAPNQRRSLLTFVPPVLTSACTVDDLADAHRAATSLPWDATTFDTFDEMLGDLDEAGISVSDRRLRASAKIAAASALLNDHATVYPIDLEPLQHVLWSTPEQAATAAQKIVARANPLGAKLDTLLAEADEITRAAVDATSRIDAVAKLDALLKEARQIANTPGANGRAKRVVNHITREHTRVQARALSIPEDKIAKMLAAIE
jgi:MoxR-like ATPase